MIHSNIRSIIQPRPSVFPRPSFPDCCSGKISSGDVKLWNFLPACYNGWELQITSSAFLIPPKRKEGKQAMCDITSKLCAPYGCRGLETYFRTVKVNWKWFILFHAFKVMLVAVCFLARALFHYSTGSSSGPVSPGCGFGRQWQYILVVVGIPLIGHRTASVFFSGPERTDFWTNCVFLLHLLSSFNRHSSVWQWKTPFTAFNCEWLEQYCMMVSA